MPPEPLDAAIIFAPVGALVPPALKAVRKGGRVSVANLTRQDGIDFLRLAPKIGIVAKTTTYPLKQANQALADLRAGRFEGASVLVP